MGLGLDHGSGLEGKAWLRDYVSAAHLLKHYTADSSGRVHAGFVDDDGPDIERAGMTQDASSSSSSGSSADRQAANELLAALAGVVAAGRSAPSAVDGDEDTDLASSIRGGQAHSANASPAAETEKVMPADVAGGSRPTKGKSVPDGVKHGTSDESDDSTPPQKKDKSVQSPAPDERWPVPFYNLMPSKLKRKKEIDTGVTVSLFFV